MSSATDFGDTNKTYQNKKNIRQNLLKKQTYNKLMSALLLIFATFSYNFYLKLVCDEWQRSQANNCLGYGLVPYGTPRGAK